MVKLKNVKKRDNYIECDYYPEGDEYKGHIIYDYVKGIVVEKETVPDYDDYLEMYFNYAMRKIKKIMKSEDFKQNKFKDEYALFWY